jgi:hypothetical protein
MKKLVFLAAVLISGVSVAQQFSIKRVEVAGDQINLYYDLLDSIASRTYTITLSSSRDNFITPLQKVKGDLGLEVKPGSNKRIVWNAKEELGPDFDGKVGLEVRGRLYIPFVRLDGLNKTFKRLRPTEMTWTGGTQQNILNFDLYRGEDKITSFPNIANVGHYTMTIPTTVKPGKGYKFKITDSRNKDQIVYSAPFAITRKIPLLLKAIPVVLVGGAAYLLASGNKSPSDLPDPIVPSN